MTDSGVAARKPGNSRRIWLTLVCLFGLFVLGTRFNLNGYELEYVLSARNIFATGSPALAPGFTDLPGVPSTAVPDPVYPRQQFAQAYASVPFYALGAWLFGNEAAYPGEPGIYMLPWGPAVMVALLNPLSGVITILLAGLLAVELGLPRRQLEPAMILLGLSTMIWPYSGIGLEIFSAMILTATVYGAVRFRNTGGTGSLALALIGLALLPNTKKFDLIFLPPLGLYLIWAMFHQRKSRSMTRMIAALTGAGVVGAGLFLLTIWIKSRHNPGYLPHLTGKLHASGFPLTDILFGIVASPNEGFFIFNPIFLFALAGWRDCWQRRRAETLLILGILLMLAGSFLRLPYLLIDEVWGPRYLLVMVPLLFAAGAGALLRERHGIRRIVFIGILILSLAVQFLGVTFMGYALMDTAIALGTGNVLTAVFSPSLSQIPVAGRAFLSTLHRLATGESLTLSHIVISNYSGGKPNYESRSVSLSAADKPVGFLLTGRWALGSLGNNVWPEADTFALHMILVTGLVTALLMRFRRRRSMTHGEGQTVNG